jgi:hypothetical protein
MKNGVSPFLLMNERKGLGYAQQGMQTVFFYRQAWARLRKVQGVFLCLNQMLLPLKGSLKKMVVTAFLLVTSARGWATPNRECKPSFSTDRLRLCLRKVQGVFLCLNQLLYPLKAPLVKNGR